MIYIVIPCYNEQEVLEDTTGKLASLIATMEGEQVRILYTDDGSRDATWALIGQMHDRYPFVEGVRLAHNVGHQRALWAGMEAVASRAEAIVSIDADLQDDIRVIPRMVADFRRGADIVYGVRRERATDTAFKRVTALFFYRLMNALGSHLVYNHADFRLLSHRALCALLSYPERNLFLRGMVPMLGFNECREYYDRLERQAGVSKYPLSRMIALAMDGITSLSVKPLRWTGVAGVCSMLVAMGVIVWALARHCQGHTIAGWTSLLISVWLVGGLLLLAICVLGEYIGKVYQEVKRRPRYFIMDSVGRSTDGASPFPSSPEGGGAERMPGERDACPPR